MGSARVAVLQVWTSGNRGGGIRSSVALHVVIGLPDPALEAFLRGPVPPQPDSVHPDTPHHDGG